MRFFGIIEGDVNARFMLGMPLLGLCMMNDGRCVMGHITGELVDLQTLGHISAGYRGDFMKWLNELKAKFPVGSFPDKYEMKICTYKEACERALELYPDILDVKTVGGPVIKYDMTSIKNKLRKVIESE